MLKIVDRLVVFCDWLVQNHRLNPNVIVLDQQYIRYRAHQNQNAMREGNFQEKCGINVWAGIVENKIICSILFHGQLTEFRYSDFHHNEIEDHLNNLLWQF